MEQVASAGGDLLLALGKSLQFNRRALGGKPMAYSDGYQERQAGMSAGAKIVIALVLLIGLPIIAAMGYGIYSAFMISPETRFERAIAKSPEARGFAKALKVKFHGEYAEMHDAAIREIVQGGNESDAQRVVLNNLRWFGSEYRDEVARASDQHLSALMAVQVDASKVASRHVAICRAGLLNRQEQLPKLNEREEQALEVSTVKFVEAAASGRDRPVKRAAYAYADQQALVAKMKAKGYTLADLELLGQPSTDQGVLLRKCRINGAMIEALVALPREQGLRIYAHLIGGPRN
jgi:hypothetical protein